MSFMKGKIFNVVKKSEAWRVTGKAPVSTKWVGTDKNQWTRKPMIWPKWVARDFKDPMEKDREEDLFSATPPLEMMRFILSRQATRRKDGRERQNHVLRQKRKRILHRYAGRMCTWSCRERRDGCRPAAQPGEEHYSALL